MNPTAASAPIPSQAVLTAISDPTRWRILQTILHTEPLPAGEIARRLGVPATNISKHCAVLKNAGILQRGFGGLYKIPPERLTEGGRSLDLGLILLRLGAPAPTTTRILPTKPAAIPPPSPGTTPGTNG